MKNYHLKLMLVLFAVITLAASPVFAGKPPRDPEICNNGIDDDRDKKIDCNDSDCMGDPACPAGECASYTDKDVCNADPNCEWLGKGRDGYCWDVLIDFIPVRQNLGFLDISSGFTEEPHESPEAQAGQCKTCHDLVDDMDDGHYIPTDEPSLVTPWPSGKDGANGPGNCIFCHKEGLHEGDSGSVFILDNASNHHNTGLHDKKGTKCGWCHDDYTVRPDSITTSAYSIRTCEGCHGPDSLHNIQADSNGDGVITPGGELAGYGHIGRDAGPDDSDCWGCHGFMVSAAAMTQSAGESAAAAVDPHHGLVGAPMPTDSAAPNASATYKCLSCHMLTENMTIGSSVFAPVDDCLTCHIDGPPTN